MNQNKSLTDSQTTLNELKELVSDFIADRNWQQYHTPRNIAVSVTLEAAELLEHFQWVPPAPSEISQEKKQQIEEELSDVLAYLLSLANVLEIDVSDALAKKMVKNRRKYPENEYNGNWKNPDFEN